MERGRHIADLFGRAGIVAYFTFASIIQCIRIYDAIVNWHVLDEPHRIFRILSECAVLVFLGLIVVITLYRHKPLASASEWEPRISALAGTFLLGLLALVPQAERQSLPLTITALMLVLTGTLLSVYVLAWLGRSFSITAQARRLVTEGPYAIVRHPLYVAEEITAIGVLILHWSWPAVLIAVIHWTLQLRRMHNEERVLRATFQEYDGYAKLTPRVIPRVSTLARSKTATN